MSSKRNGRQRRTESARNRRLADELNDLVATHVERCTHDAIELLARHGYLTSTAVELLQMDASPGFERDDSCDAIPDDLKGVLAAANQPEAPTMSETEARTRVASNRLRAAMQRRKLNQADLARLVNKSPAVISRVLQNPEKCRITTLRRLANALGVDLADVLAAPA